MIHTGVAAGTAEFDRLLLTDEPVPLPALDRLARMPVRRVGLLSLLEAAWEARDTLSFHDALYVALAARLEASLLTLDRGLARSPRLGIDTIVPTGR